MNVLIINETDEFQETISIGVGDSISACNKILDKYYGHYETVENTDADCNGSCVAYRVLNVPDSNGNLTNTVTITFESFTLNDY